MKRLLLAILPIFLAACGGGGGDDGTSAKLEPPPLRVFIFAGQSNMNGSDAIISPDGTQDLAETAQQTAADRATLFTMSTPSTHYAWGDVRGHAGYWNGEATVSGRVVKVHGPEVGFTRHLGGDIAIIKYANNYFATEGGRSAWVRPGSRWQSWQAFVDAQLAALGRPYTVAGLVWFQGIDDGILGRDGASYKADLRQIIADVRAKFGPVPVMIGRSIDSQIAGSAAMAPIRAAQVEVGSEPGNAWVDVDGLPLVNGHHLTAAGQLESGKRFAEAFLRLRGG